MLDLHCHILPSIDDGAKDISEALSLLKMSIEQGVSHIVFTPHIHLGRYDNTKPGIDAAFVQFQSHVEQAGLDVELAYAAEIRIDTDVLPLIAANKLPSLGEFEGERIVLLEMPSSRVPLGMNKLIKWLRDKNIRPLIAHPERNRDIQKNVQLAKELVAQGCLLQGTASSLTGLFGEKPQNTLHELLKLNLIDVIASDTHSIKRRPPEMKAAFDIVTSEYGSNVACQLFKIRPHQLTTGLFT